MYHSEHLLTRMSIGKIANIGVFYLEGFVIRFGGGMNLRSTKVQNFILAIGMLFILIGVYLLIAVSAEQTAGFFVFLRFLCLSGAGMVLLFLSLVVTKNCIHVFFGLNLLFFGILALIIDLKIFSVGLKELWPFLVISSGISLLPAGVYKLHEIKPSFFFPALVLIFLGLSLLPFSLHLVDVSLRKVVTFWGPIFCIALGLLLVMLFLFQQKNNFPYIDDDSDGKIGDFDSFLGDEP